MGHAALSYNMCVKAFTDFFLNYCHTCLLKLNFAFFDWCIGFSNCRLFDTFLAQE